MVKMKTKSKLGSLLIFIFCLYSLPAFSYSPYLDQIINEYQIRARCELCHSSNNLNIFGNDFKKSLENNGNDLLKTLKELENLDSDTDGYSNLEEIKAGSLPFDPASFPGIKSKLLLLKKSH